MRDNQAIAIVEFAADGKRCFVLTVNQAAVAHAQEQIRDEAATRHKTSNR